MSKARPALILTLALASVACDVFKPTSSGQDLPNTTAPPQSNSPTPPTVSPPSVVQADDLVASESHLFASNPGISALSVFSPQPLSADKLFVRNDAMPEGSRVLAAAPTRDLAVVLFPNQASLRVVCPTGDSLVTGLVAGADSVAVAAPAQGSTTNIIVYGKGTNGVDAPSSLSVVSTQDCDPDTQSVTTLPIASGPHEVQISADGQTVYVASSAGVASIDISGASARITPFSNLPLVGMTLALVDGHQYLIGHSGNEVVALDSAAKVTYLNRPSADAGTGAEAGAGGEAGAPDIYATPGTLSAGGAPGALTSSVDSSVSVAASGRLVLIGARGELARYELPPQDSATDSIPSPGSVVALGTADDCALAYSQGAQSISKVELDPLSAISITLSRSVDSASLFCRPASGSAPASCCSGIVVVRYVPESFAPLGETEAYGVVDLATLKEDLQVSSLAVQGQTIFDDGNALLVALGDKSSGVAQFRLSTPFVAGSRTSTLSSLTDLPAVVGSLPTSPSMAYIGLIRRDGGVIFVGRPADAAPGTGVATSSYQAFPVNDFRLPERVHRLDVGSLP